MEDIEEIEVEEIPKNTAKKASKRRKKPVVKKDNTDNYENKDVDVMPHIVSVEGKLLHVKVGNDHFPVTPADIEDVESKCLELLENMKMDCAILVTKHCVEIKVVE